ncbi:putative zinc-binding metallopeptidase, partial [Acinetobacter baumannii]
EALKRHYANGAPADWQANFVSSYATAHPWEDFAETWAHYLHIVDTLETARAFGLKIRPRITEGAELEAEVDFNPHRARRIEDLIEP